MFWANSLQNNYLNGVKLSQNIFHFQITAIFFKIGQFMNLLHIFVVSLSYDASLKNDIRKIPPCKTTYV